MKIAKSEFLPHVDRYDTDPPGPFWLMVDRSGPNWQTSLRGPKRGAGERAQIATFNEHACQGSNIEFAILERLNSAPLEIEYV